MDSTALKDRSRLDLADTEEPFLWSDEELYDYSDDAQKMFTRLTGGLPDASSALATVLSFSATSDWVATHPSILKVRQAYRPDTGNKIDVVNYEDLGNLGIRLDGRKGEPKVLIIGMEENRAKLYPAPETSGTIQLLVDRMPLKDITDGDQKLEVADKHSNGLRMWIKARAYMKQDAETYDKRQADDCEAQFTAYCAMCKLEKDRAKHKTRVVVYGGLSISNEPGYSGTRNRNHY